MKLWTKEDLSVFFSERDVPEEVINNILKTVSTAPSGADKQPWTFCVIRNKALKHELRKKAEIEERINYESRMSDTWKEDLAHLGTDDVKEFIDIAPWIVIFMRKPYDLDENGNKKKQLLRQRICRYCKWHFNRVYS